MGKYVSWIGRVPWWAWLLLAAGQVLMIYEHRKRMVSREETIQRLPDGPDYADIRDAYEGMIRSDQHQILFAAALMTFSLCAALWSGICRRATHDQPDDADTKAGQQSDAE